MQKENAPMELHENREHEYDAVVVLGAAMQWNANRSRWDFPSIIEDQPGKLVAGKARALAAREVADDTSMFLVTGGITKHPETGKPASRSEELARLMTDRYHMAPEKIIPMGRVGESTTLGNVENVVLYFREHPAILRTKRIAILSIGSHLERAKLLFENNPFFKEQGIAIVPLAAEDILEERSSRYRKWAEALYATPQGQEHLQMEKQGIADLKKGAYKPKTP